MTAALVLAAGITKSNSKFSPMSELGGKTLVRRIIYTYQDAGIDKIVFITGHKAKSVEQKNSKHGVLFLRNENYAKSDMLGSVKIGLDYLQDKCDRVFISSVDTPFFLTETVKTLLSSAMPDIDMVAPVYEGKTGHPLLVSKSTFDEIQRYTGDSGLRFLMTLPALKKSFIDVPDRGVFFNPNSDYAENDLNEFVAALPPKKLRSQVRVRLSDNESFFGIGVFEVLKSIDEFESLNIGCQNIGISATKARNIISSAVKVLGFPLIKGQSGGKGVGGRTYVTKQGYELMGLFEAYQNEVTEFNKTAFEKYFGDYKLD